MQGLDGAAEAGARQQTTTTVVCQSHSPQPRLARRDTPQGPLGPDTAHETARTPSQELEHLPGNPYTFDPEQGLQPVRCRRSGTLDVSVTHSTPRDSPTMSSPSAYDLVRSGTRLVLSRTFSTAERSVIFGALDIPSFRF